VAHVSLSAADFSSRRLASPLYEYQCKDCGEAIEVRASIKDKEAGLVLSCPTCGSQDVCQRLTVAATLRGNAAR
jgi:putative FmdB family regulatory protein